jgi:hypothetical protein
MKPQNRSTYLSQLKRRDRNASVEDGADPQQIRSDARLKQQMD